MMLPEFVGIAEECGLIVPIGQLLLRQACRQAKAWQDPHKSPLTVSVNISALEFRHPHFLDSLRTILQETGLEGRFLELELTEGVLMRDVDASKAILSGLKQLGVRIAIDDFGTGYSNISCLSQFPIDVLKIDRSFVRDISAGVSTGTIVNAVISMGASLRQKVIAEGIETKEQHTFLNAHHCNEGQGYFLGRPEAAIDFAKNRLPH